MPVSALDLPAELIRRVADEIVNSSVIGLVAVGETDNLWPVRDVLSWCSLTCRYWSKIFRSYIFFEISLRSRDDVDELSSFIESPGSYIHTFIEVLRITLQDWSYPWLHHILPLTERLPKFRRATLDFEKPPVGTSIGTLTTLHPLLPTAVPSCFSNFASLNLAAHQFNEFSELTRLVRSLPALQDITCSQLSWKQYTTSRDMQRGLYFSNSLRDVSTVACQEDAPMLWLLVTNKRMNATAGSPVITVPGMTAIVNIVEALLKCGRTRDQPQVFLMFATSMHVLPPSLDSPTVPQPDLYPHPTQWQVVFRSTLTGPAFLARFVLVAATPFAHVGQIFLNLRLSEEEPDAPPKVADALSDELTQNPLDDLEKFPVRTASEELLALAWDELDGFLADMAGLRGFEVEVDVSKRLSKEDFAREVETIRGRMPRMCEGEKLQLKGVNSRKESKGKEASSTQQAPEATSK